MSVLAHGVTLSTFEVSNNFFEVNGHVVDAAGQDWDET
jgi:hypothetical protein